jgi:hypothetical protein
MEKDQPLAAPSDVRRYFVTPKESGELCLMSCLLGDNRDVFFPKLDQCLNLITFSVIKNQPSFDQARLEHFETRIRSLRSAGTWTRTDLMDLFNQMIPGFNHKETGKFLDGRM